MARYEREKGARIEREIVEMHKELGVYAERVPLSGATRFRGASYDVDIYPWGKSRVKLSAEVKARGNGAGFTLLERWLANHDCLFLRKNNAKPMVLVPWHIWAHLMKDHGDANRSTNTQPGLNGKHDAVT